VSELQNEPKSEATGLPASDPGGSLNLMVPAALEVPFYRSLFNNIKELISPPKLPPLEITSKPITQQEIQAELRGGPSGQLLPGENDDKNLRHLLPPATLETPFYKSLYESVRELINPPKLPPLELTSKPVEIPTMKGLYSGNEWKAGLGSLLIQGGLLALLLLLGTNKHVQQKIKEVYTLVAPELPKLPPKPDLSKGGGGSPNRTPVTKAELPKPAPKAFVAQRIENPKLTLPASIVAPDMPNIIASNFGDPLAGIGLPSTGNGLGNGIGSGRGNGVGPGSGGGTGGGAYKPGGGVTAPIAILKPEPEYSEEARKAKWSGSVMISLVVDVNGMPQSVQVVKPLGLGLDQKAIEAIMKWRFKPGTKDGKPVPVQATVEVNFRLL
jgi:protein TonB